jgi:two-component system LytT family response regulator
VTEGVEGVVRTLIVDDETESRQGLEALVEAEPGFQVVGTCSSGPAAVDRIRAGSVDLALLDIQMPGMSGFDVLRALPADERPVVVFVTAFDRYALEAFEAHALDYVLKPFSDARLSAALGRARERVRLRRMGELTRRLADLLEDGVEGSGEGGPSPLRRIVVRGRSGVEFVPVEEVIRITAEDYYVRIHLEGGSHLLRDSLKRLERRLPPDLFVRTHRSAIVNLRMLRRVEEDTDSGSYSALLADGSRVPVARSRLDGVVEAVRESG